MFRLPFLEDTTPPPFYLPQLNQNKRTQLDKWFIGSRSQTYYLKRFQEFDAKGKLYPRWNWAAFFGTFGWLLYRKRYLDCLVYCVAGWSFIKLNIVIILVMCQFLFIDKLPLDLQMPVRIGIGLSIWLFWSAMVARWADAYYYRMARREIADAVDFYTDEPTQKQYLQQHGGVSLLGLLGAFGVFGTLLSIIALQFVPIIAMQKEKALILESYQYADAVQKRVEVIYNTSKNCPVGMPATSSNQKISIEVTDKAFNFQTDCAIIATVTKAPYPVRYLNGQNLVIYHTKNKQGESIWRCQTSLNKEQAPKRCL
jgi:putative membrane protein